MQVGGVMRGQAIGGGMNKTGTRCFDNLILGILGATLLGCQSSARLDPRLDPSVAVVAGLPAVTTSTGSSPRFAANGPDADESWVIEATTVPADRPDLNLVWPDPRFGYGYQTWVFDGERRMFALIGAHGQAIYVDPTSRLVMVHTAVRKNVSDPNTETLALWRGALEMLGGGTR